MTEQETNLLIQKMEGKFASELSMQKLQGDVQGLKTDMKEVRGDIAHLEDKVDTIAERMNEIPTKYELEAMLSKLVDIVVLKAEHEHMKKIIEAKLGVEV
ncbi:MAG: hypothetical protein G01um101470_272 [Parcubacteria group bacterium Gr01-1014_70]|nr:MAG: hypothetical protein G01um101470_272 [Parcubacteria group bacterium Gr01-1014_70]